MHNLEIIQKIFEYLTPARSGRYLHSIPDPVNAFKLYELNSKLCGTFWVSIQWYEVILRNLIDKALSQAYSANWLEERSFLFTLKQQKQQSIEKAKKFASKNGQHHKNDVIASLSLSVWLEILSPKFLNQVWLKCIDDTFINRPKNQEVADFIKELSKRSHQILKLRNRIAHHEPIYYMNIQEAIDAISFTLVAIAPELLLVINKNFQASQDIKHEIKTLIKQNKIAK
ncbi:Abi family protein [Moraxella marmotae]|uniref:Abi family protein n=1 Tax=Moraxella marmotae TaxID=3344520 RepID=UPI0035F3330E